MSPDRPDLTAELDAAEDIVMGRAETVVTEWGVDCTDGRGEHRVNFGVPPSLLLFTARPAVSPWRCTPGTAQARTHPP